MKKKKRTHIFQSDGIQSSLLSLWKQFLPVGLCFCSLFKRLSVHIFHCLKMMIIKEVSMFFHGRDVSVFCWNLDSYTLYTPDIGCHLNAIDEQGNEKKWIPKSQDCRATQRSNKNTEYFQGNSLYKVTNVILGIRIRYSARYTKKLFSAVIFTYFWFLTKLLQQIDGWTTQIPYRCKFSIEMC